MKAGSRCAIAGFLCSAAAFALASFLAPDVAVRETVRDNLVYHSQLTAGIDTVLVNITEEDAGEEIHEETGISVKTLNRTIRRLKEEGLVGITKGKVTMTPEQIARAKEYIGKQTCKGKV